MDSIRHVKLLNTSIYPDHSFTVIPVINNSPKKLLVHSANITVKSKGMLKKHPVNVLMKRRMNYMLKTKIKCTSIYISKIVIAQKTQPIISRSFEMTIHLQDV